MKTVGYARISGRDQDPASQRLRILDYAHSNGFKIDEFVEVQQSSQNSPEKRGLTKLLDALTPGDTLVVTELSRLGRSVGQVVQLADLSSSVT